MAKVNQAVEQAEAEANAATEATAVEEKVTALQVICRMQLPADAAKTGTIEVPAKKNGKTATLVYTFGANLKAMATLFGEDVVFSQALAQMKIKLQGLIRNYLEVGKDPKDILAIWKPGVAMPRVAADPEVATLNYFDNLDPEAQAAMIAKIQDRISKSA